MKSFEIKPQLINDIILFFQNYYGLDPKILEPLLIKDPKDDIQNDEDNYFLLDSEKDGDNNFVINIPNVSLNHQSSINLLHKNE